MNYEQFLFRFRTIYGLENTVGDTKTQVGSVSALAVANVFLDCAEAEVGRELTHIGVQKLVYFAHGWHLAITDKPLIIEQVEAWPLGPVIESLYHAFKHFKGKKITSRASMPDFQNGEVEAVRAKLPANIDHMTVSVIQAVWEKYKNLSGGQFIAITHQPGTPWQNIADQYNGSPRSVLILNEDIRDHFVGLVHENVRNSQVTA